MAKKITAVILSLLMILCIVPFAASADEEVASAKERVTAWESNFALVTEKLLDNESAPHWKYVAENNDELSKTMLTYTAFSLYDDAWKNGFDNSVSIDKAEEILVSLIEKIDANIGESKLAEIRKVLETAVSFNDLLQKVNKYLEFSDTLNSSSWNTAFRYIKWTIEAEKLYEEERERVIEAYSQILSVRAANELYLEFLEYVAANADYDVVVAAANNLIADIKESVEDLIKKEVLSAADFGASKLFNTAARIAMESNAYTAVALKVYDIGTSAADVLWNTSDQFVLMDQLYTTFFVEDCAVDFAKNVNDAERKEFGIGAVLALRKAGAQSLYDLKLAQNAGVVGKISNQINYNIGFENVAELSFLDLAGKVLFEIPVKDYRPINSIVSFNTNAAVVVNDKPLDKAYDSGAEGYYVVDFNDVNGYAVKTLFATLGKQVRIFSASNNFATVVVEKLVNGKLEDYSFTNVLVGANNILSFDSALTGDATYNYTNGEETSTVDFNSEFVYPRYNAVTPETVVNAVVDVAKDEVKGKIISLQDFLDQIFAKIRELLNKIFYGEIQPRK